MRFGRVWATRPGLPLTDVTGPWPLSTTYLQPRRFVSRAVIDPTTATSPTSPLPRIAGGPRPPRLARRSTRPPTSHRPARRHPSHLDPGQQRPSRRARQRLRGGPADPSHLFAGTDIGVYRSADGGASWLPYGTGLPRVTVFDMALHGPRAPCGSPPMVAASGRSRRATPRRPSAASRRPASASAAPHPLLRLHHGGIAHPPGQRGHHRERRDPERGHHPAGTGFFATSFDTSGLCRRRLSDRLRLRGSHGLQPGPGGGTLTVSALLGPTTVVPERPRHLLPERCVPSPSRLPRERPTGDVALQIDGGAALVQTLSGVRPRSRFPR